MKAIEYTPPPAKLTWWRKILSFLPGFCKYCGKRYVRCSGSEKSITASIPLGEDGWCCPDAHEGYLEAFHPIGGYMERTYIDNVELHSQLPLANQASSQ